MLYSEEISRGQKIGTCDIWGPPVYTSRERGDTAHAQ